MSFDMKEVQTQVEKVLKFSQDLMFTPEIDKLMQKWFQAKSDIIECFDGNLIYEAGPMTFTLGKEERYDKISEFMGRCERVYNNPDLSWFLYMNRDSFFDNVVEHSYIMPQGDIIPEGMKLLKAFKYFENDESTLKALQTEASMLIQENKIEGILCFSVHPLDFLSSSENTYNWRSCHALDGEYRSGNLSYMCDKSTIVCYLRGKEKETFIPRFPDDVKWNSKKWRMLLFLSESWQAIFAGRQYPFTSESGLEAITPHLRNALKQDPLEWSKWHNDILMSYEYKNKLNSENIDYTNKTVVLGHKYYDMDDLIQDGKGSRHFNDLLKSSCYTPFYQWRKMSRTPKNSRYPSGYGEHFTIGASAPCICCGQANIASTDRMFCDSCYLDIVDDEEDTAICDCCGARWYTEDMSMTTDGSWVCDICRLNECIYCNRCGQLVFTNDSKYDKVTGHYYCEDCYNHIIERRSR